MARDIEKWYCAQIPYTVTPVDAIVISDTNSLIYLWFACPFGTENGESTCVEKIQQERSYHPNKLEALQWLTDKALDRRQKAIASLDEAERAMIELEDMMNKAKK